MRKASLFPVVIAILFILLMFGGNRASAQVFTGAAFTVEVNYDMDLEDLLLPVGSRAQWPALWSDFIVENGIVFDNLPENGEREGVQEVTVELVRLRIDTRTSSQELIDELGRRGYRPADIFELLSFADEYPTAYLSWHIVAFGSLRRSSDTGYLTFVPYLRQEDRSLRFKPFSELWWPELSLFAVVRLGNQDNLSIGSLIRRSVNCSPSPQHLLRFSFQRWYK